MEKKKKRRWAIGIVSGLLLLLLLIQATFLFFGDEILKKSILLGFQQYSQEAFEPSRQPELNFENLSLNLLNGNFSLEGLTFSGYLPSREGTGDHLQLYVPEASIEGLSLLDLYRESRVQLGDINFIQPDIQLLKSEEVDSLALDAHESIRASTVGLYQLITPYLKSFSFNQLNIEDGNLFVTRPGQDSTSSNRFYAKHVYVSLYDFLLDSLSLENTERIFFTRDFEVSLGDYQVITPDSTFLIQSDTLGYSSREKRIYLKNLRAYPLMPDSLSVNFLLAIPEVSLTEVSWKEIYFDSLFYADQLIIDQPMMSLSTLITTDSSKIRKGFGLRNLSVAQLYPLIKTKIKELRVNDLVLQRGRLHMEQTGKDTMSLLSIHDVNLLLAGIRIDSGALLRDSLNRIFPADTAIMRLQDIRMYLPDRQHYLTVSEAKVSTSRQQDFVCDVIIDSLNFKPGYDSLEQLLLLPPRQPLAFEVFIPQLRFDGIQLEALNQHQAAVLDSIYILSPDIRIANFSPVSLGKRAAGLSDEILDTLTTEETVKSILYDWSHARLSLHPFIAPGDSSAFLQWLNATKLQLDSGTLEIVRSDTQKYAFVPVTKVDTFYTFLKNIKIDHLPDDTLIISDRGRVAVRADEVDVFLQSGEFVLPGEGEGGGTLRVEDARASTLTSEVYLRNIYYRTSPGYPPNTDFWLHQMYIPYVQLKEIDLQKLYEEQLAEATSFSAWSPRFTFNFRKSGIVRPKISFDFENLYPQFSAYLEGINLGWVSINDADLTIRKIKRGRIDSLFTTQKLNLGLSGFYIDSLTRMSSTRPFYASKLDLQLEKYRWNFLPDDTTKQLQGMAGNELHYDSYEGQLDVEGLEVLVNTESDPYLEKLGLQAQKIMADDIDPYRLIRSNNLQIGRLIIQQPSFELAELDGRETEEDKAVEEWTSLQPDMNQLLSEHLKKIELRFVHVEEGKLNYLKRSGRDTLSAIQLDSVDFLARNIKVDGSRKRHLQHVLYADDVDYSLVSGKLLFNQPNKHRIEIQKAGLSSRTSRIYLEGISVQPSKTLIENTDKSHIESLTESLTINGLDLNRAYLYGDLKIQQLLPRNAQLKVSLGNATEPDGAEPLTMRESLSPYIRSIDVQELRFPRGELSLINKKSGEPVFSSKRIAASITGFSINQQKLESPATEGSKVFYSDDISINIRDYSRKTEDGLYNFLVDGVDIGTASRSVDITNFRMQPLLDRQEVLERFKYAKSLSQLSTEQISFNGLDFEKLLNDSEWHVDNVEISRPVLEVLRDQRLPHDDSKRPPLHQKMLFDLNQLVNIDKVFIKDGFISYAEHTPGADGDGVITFEKVNAQILNLSNQTETLQDEELIEMEVEAMVMGEGKLNAFFQFPADTTSMNFSVQGTMGPMQLSHFNQILGPSAFVHVKEGINQNLQFKFSGDEQRSSGSMEFRYNDLNVLMIDKEKGQAGFDEKLGSFIANAFVLKANNPKSVFLRIGDIAYARDPSRSMFHYWWQSILSGLKSSIGLEKSTEKTKDFNRVDGG